MPDRRVTSVRVEDKVVITVYMKDAYEAIKLNDGLARQSAEGDAVRLHFHDTAFCWESQDADDAGG